MTDGFNIDHELALARAKRDALRAERAAKQAGNGWPDPYYVPQGEPAKAAELIVPRPLIFRDPKTIPPRGMLYGDHYYRKFFSTTLAPGGSGKTSEVMVELTSMATGLNLLGFKPVRPMRAWYWNLEDPMEELERRFAAIFLHYGITEEDIGGRLFVNSGRQDRLIIATRSKDQTIISPHAEALTDKIIEFKIDVLAADPFIKTHNIPENDNTGIDDAVEEWARISDHGNCAIELSHHVRKPSSGQTEFSIYDGRGASSLIYGARVARVLNTMTEDEAGPAGVSPESRKSYFRIDNGKHSLRAPAEKAEWRKFISVPLYNGTDDYPLGDSVGVVTEFKMPGIFDGAHASDITKVQDALSQGEWAENVQANDWAGHAIANVCNLDADNPKDRAIIKGRIKSWLTSGVIKVIRVDVKGRTRQRPIIVAGKRI
jgi:hypothetical protein